MRLTFPRLLALSLFGLAPLLHGADLLDDIRFYDIRSGDPIDLGAVSPETVEGFEILYATPGTGDISEIAGHLLLRIKLRNQRHPVPGQRANPNDVVISFLADTESEKTPQGPTPLVITEDCRKRNWFNLVNNDTPPDESPFASLWQSLRGLSGGFRVIMDRQTLAVTLKSYTVEQNRDLLRYRLNLSEAQKAALLDHLLHVRDHYEPPYYFFSQNCGSVLVQVVGEGIGDETIARFHPAVAPPHTLIGTLIRNGHASPVFPSFYSTGKLGFIAREVLQEALADWAKREPRWDPASAADLFDANETRRAAAVDALRVAGDQFPLLRPGLIRCYLLIQEAERVTDHKGRLCEQYTSAATAAARRLHRLLLKENPELANIAVLPTRDLSTRYAQTEQSVWADRSHHTQHYAWSIGAGWLSGSGTVLTLDGALLKQDMGSRSAVAMQRGSAVTLGGFSVVADADGLREWTLTGLRLHKFRDSLHRVTPVTHSSRGWGMGLQVLEVHHSDLAPHTHGILAGAAVLANIASSAAHDDYLYLSTGPTIAWNRHDRETQFDFEWPIEAHALTTWGKLQARASGSITAPSRGGAPSRVQGSMAVSLPVASWGGAEHLLSIGADYLQLSASEYAPSKQDRFLTRLQWEVRRW